MKKVLIGLSGGLDSTTLLGLLLEQGCEVHCCIFTYGSKHNAYENEAALNILEYYYNKGCTVSSTSFNLEEVFKPFKSNLLLSGEDIPTGHYQDDNMKQTVVPGRNLIFASIMAGLAETIEANTIALGVHAGDHLIYPDCRPEFIKALDSVIYLSSDKKVEVLTPLLNLDKTEILQKGYNLKIPVPYQYTRTCYTSNNLACGKCGSCNERLEAFNNLNLNDPISYE